jgi:DNA-binding NarL/FixJ family response regulator
MHGGSRGRVGNAPRLGEVQTRPDPSEGVHSVELSATARAWSEDSGHAPRIPGVRVTVVETAPSGASGQPQVARWIAAEAISRGFHVRLKRSDQMLERVRHRADVALLLLHGLPPEWQQDQPTVPWERWAAATNALVAQGTVVIIISAGARAAAVAACCRLGAEAVVDVDNVKRALDVVEDAARGILRGDELQSVLPCPYSPEQLGHLASLTTNETRVLFHLVCGYSAEYIANAQWTSLSTVRAHIRSIFRKLGVRSQIAAIAYANGTATDPLDSDELGAPR